MQLSAIHRQKVPVTSFENEDSKLNLMPKTIKPHVLSMKCALYHRVYPKD